MAIKILIVDDSPSLRKYLTESLQNVQGLEVCGWASNGVEALARVKTLQPNVVILDIEMPLMDGLETLAELMAVNPVPVLVLSSFSARGSVNALRALELGAVDVYAKPEDPNLWPSTCQAIIAGIRVASNVNLVRRNKGSNLPLLKASDYEVILIGCSTGGPAALARILPRLPAHFPVPIAIVQHMPFAFIVGMAARFDQFCSNPVRVAKDGDIMGRGGIWIAPGESQTIVSRQGKALTLKVGSQSSYKGPYHPSVDMLFTSAARVCKTKILAFVLTGMGKDGLEGARAIRQEGGKVITQDEGSSVVYGMPGVVTSAGLANWQLSLNDISRLLCNIQGV